MHTYFLFLLVHSPLRNPLPEITDSDRTSPTTLYDKSDNMVLKYPDIIKTTLTKRNVLKTENIEPKISKILPYTNISNIFTHRTRRKFMVLFKKLWPISEQSVTM